MELFKINGGEKLGGEISVHGAKNSALPILAATLLIKGESVIHNCPDISDVSAMLNILDMLGCRIKRENDTVFVDASVVKNNEISEEIMRTMRSSIIFLSALCVRTGGASIYYPGGCEIGNRPIDLHLKALKALGAVVCEDGSSIYCRTNGIIGTKIVLPFPSVGATENIIIAAAISRGKTVIVNPAREPEICDLADFLNHCGAKIYGAGESEIIIDGVNVLYPYEHTIIPDRIEASSFMAIAAQNHSELLIKNINARHLSPVFPLFTESGCKLRLVGHGVLITPPKRLKRVRMIKTMPYPGFPTDSQPLIASALATARGTSVIEETVFENRYGYISELNRFGADIDVRGKLAVINGVKSLHAANVRAGDLRGGAALVAAALSAEGESTISGIKHIDRGYDSLEKTLSSIGADIKRIKNEGTEEKNEKAKSIDSTEKAADE